MIISIKQNLLTVESIKNYLCLNKAQNLGTKKTKFENFYNIKIFIINKNNIYN